MASHAHQIGCKRLLATTFEVCKLYLYSHFVYPYSLTFNYLQERAPRLFSDVLAKALLQRLQPCRITISDSSFTAYLAQHVRPPLIPVVVAMGVSPSSHEHPPPHTGNFRRTTLGQHCIHLCSHPVHRVGRAADSHELLSHSRLVSMPSPLMRRLCTSRAA